MSRKRIYAVFIITSFTLPGAVRAQSSDDPVNQDFKQAARKLQQTPQNPRFPQPKTEATKTQQAMVYGADIAIFGVTQHFANKSLKNVAAKLDTIQADESASWKTLRDREFIPTAALDEEFNALKDRQQQAAAAVAKAKGSELAVHQKRLDQVDAEIQEFNQNRPAREEALFATKKDAMLKRLRRQAARAKDPDEIMKIRANMEEVKGYRLGHEVVTEAKHRADSARAVEELSLIEQRYAGIRRGQLKTFNFFRDRGLGKSALQFLVLADMAGRAWVLYQGNDPGVTPLMVPIDYAMGLFSKNEVVVQDQLDALDAKMASGKRLDYLTEHPEVEDQARQAQATIFGLMAKAKEDQEDKDEMQKTIDALKGKSTTQPNGDNSTERGDDTRVPAPTVDENSPQDHGAAHNFTRDPATLSPPIPYPNRKEEPAPAAP